MRSAPMIGEQSYEGLVLGRGVETRLSRRIESANCLGLSIGYTART